LKVAVVGATGVLGRNVITALLARNHSVHAIARNPDDFPLLNRVSLFRGDILNKGSLTEGLAGCDAALHLATAIPKRGEPTDWSRNTAVRTTGTRNLLEASADAKVCRYVQQSMVLVYADGGDQWITEASSIANPSALTKPMLEMEELVAVSTLDWVILRGGVFYGPGTERMYDWNEHALAGSLAMPGGGADFVSLIHVQDMADAVAAAVDSPLHREIVNVVDDEPVTYRELFDFIAYRHGAPAPKDGGALVFPSLRVSNARAREQLAWKPRYPSFREGWLSGPMQKLNS
jgi:nucleoside-diphosphate-sugar epimerase